MLITPTPSTISIEIGLDPLTIVENNTSQSVSTLDGYSTPPQTDQSLASSSTSSRDSGTVNTSGPRRRFSLINPFTWFQKTQDVVVNEKESRSESPELELESESVSEAQNENEMLIAKIMMHFRNNEVEKLMEIEEIGKSNSLMKASSFVESGKDVDFVFSDDYIDDEIFYVEPVKRPVELSAPFPSIQKKKKLFPSKVLKSVRFEMDNTPEQHPTRSFTPLFTSTPRIEDVKRDSEDEEDPVSLKQCDSNTVMPPDMSSILVRSDSIISALNKSRQESVNLALDHQRTRSYYRICYDDTDEEEVEDDKPQMTVGETFSINKFSDIRNTENDITEPLGTFTIQRDPNDSEATEVCDDSSLDSSVSLEFEQIDECLDILELELRKNLARDKADIRNSDAWRCFELLDDKIERIHKTLMDVKTKFANDEQQSFLMESSSFVNLSNPIFDKPKLVEGGQNVLDDSNWAEANDFGGVSYDSSEIIA